MTNNFTKAVNSFIAKIGCQKTYMCKSHMTSGNQYFITISYNGKQAKFVFHDNYMNKSKKEDFLSALVSDALAFDRAENFEEFVNEFGYTNRREASRVYVGCMSQSKRLHRLFTDEEIALLAMLD